MVDQVEGCEKSFQYFLQVICGWHLLRSVLMTNGEEAGQRSCSIDLQAKALLMVTQ
jgi:hypothetical protein